MISRELYAAIVEAETACRKAHDLCYQDGGRYGAGCSICGIIALGGPLLCEHGVTPQLEITIDGHVDFVPDESLRRFINGE